MNTSIDHYNEEIGSSRNANQILYATSTPDIFYVKTTSDETKTSTQKVYEADQPRTLTGTVNPIKHIRQSEILISFAKWIGLIEEIDIKNEVFTARLQELGTTKRIIETGEFEFNQVSDAERHLIQIGAEFYFNVGYLTTANGTRTRAGVISFRRLLKVTAEEIEIAEMMAHKFNKEIQFE
ncbi:MAG: hypothetical protein AMXMBFR48_21960 [Ignavibacteriales bacterium]